MGLHVLHLFLDPGHGKERVFFTDRGVGKSERESERDDSLK